MTVGANAELLARPPPDGGTAEKQSVKGQLWCLQRDARKAFKNDSLSAFGQQRESTLALATLQMRQITRSARSSAM